jgi:hypothetical protein
MALPFTPRRIVYHDYGGHPDGSKEGVFNPYHVLVFPDGSVRYRNPENPYGGKAPHAFMLNNTSLGLSYAGDVGERPTPAAMRALQQEYEKIQSRHPGIPGFGHGETGWVGSRDGREMKEASWRDRVGELSNVPQDGLRPLALLGSPEQVATAAPAPGKSPFVADVPTPELAVRPKIAQAAPSKPPVGLVPDTPPPLPPVDPTKEKKASPFAPAKEEPKEEDQGARQHAATHAMGVQGALEWVKKQQRRGA